MVKITGKLMLIGSMPPPVGGTSISFKNLYCDLIEKGVDVSLVNTSVVEKNRFVAIIGALFSLIANRKEIDAVSVQLGIGALAKFGILFVIVSKLTGKIIVLRRFGGVCVHELGFLSAFSIRLSYWLSDAVLCQTKSQLSEITNKGVWFPTARSESLFLLKNTYPKQVKKILFVSQVKREKGVFHLVQAFRALRDRYDIELEIYGPILLSSKDTLLFELEARDFYKGEVDEQHVSELLLGSDLLVLPTFYGGEGYPGILVEGMLSGIGMISTNWLSIPELVGNCALICEPDNLSSLEKTLNEYLSNPCTRKNLYSQCAARRSSFSQENQTENFINVMFSKP